jgi:hypothetical protein
MHAFCWRSSSVRETAETKPGQTAQHPLKFVTAQSESAAHVVDASVG